MRRDWKGDAAQVSDLATRLTGSSDIFENRGRRPWASVNFVTAHEGFTLADLVSYKDKHNLANGEDNREVPITTTAGIAASRDRPTMPRFAACV